MKTCKMFLILLFFFMFANANVIEDRRGDEWTYKPTIDYVCNFIGCCGNLENPCSPEYWKYLNTDTFERCQHKQQSPINIELVNSYINIEYDLIFEENSCNGTVILRNNTWEIDFLEDKKCSAKTFENTTWYLYNFHIHSAEHTIDGEYVPLEIHYVHKDTDKNIMVISLLVSGTSSKSVYQPLLQIFEQNKKKNSFVDIFPYSLIGQNPSYWYYRGSLTTPPCQTTNQSDVHWFIIKDYLEIPHQQIYFFTEYLNKINKSYNGHVSRPIQDLHQNTIIFSYK